MPPAVILASVAAVAREVAHAAAVQRGAGRLAVEQKMHRVGPRLTKGLGRFFRNDQSKRRAKKPSPPAPRGAIL